MKTKVLIVVDMQNDFIDGTLGTAEAKAIVPSVVEKIRTWSGDLFVTQDTHKADYLTTREGMKLPVEHCVVRTNGWQLNKEVAKVVGPMPTHQKSTFGCVGLVDSLKSLQEVYKIEEIQIVGVCTDICVISNALLLKSYFYEIPIIVDASCCAGVTPEKHKAALEVMKSCQIDVIGE